MAQYPVEANILFGVFSTLTSTEAIEKSSRWLWKEKLCLYWRGKPGNNSVTDRHNMTLAVKLAFLTNLHSSVGRALDL